MILRINTLKCIIKSTARDGETALSEFACTRETKADRILICSEGNRHIYNTDMVWHGDIVATTASSTTGPSGRQKRRELVWPFSKFRIPRRRDTGDCLMEMEKGRTRRRFAEGRRFLPVWDVAAKCAKGSSSPARARRFAPNWKRQWPTYATYVIDFFLLTTTSELTPVKRSFIAAGRAAAANNQICISLIFYILKCNVKKK